jgi:polysaccharide chain length determinant protein (PEP-CTERM system associated)
MASTHIAEQTPRATSGSSLTDYANLVRRRWKYPALIVPAVIMAAVFIAYTLPVTYRGVATIMLEPASIPKEMVSSTVRDMEDIPAYAQQQLELVRRRIMTPELLEPIVKKIDPYPTRHDLDLEQKAAMLGQDTSVERVDPITGKPLDSSTAFSIYYLNGDRDITKKVEREIVDLYLTYNRRTRAESATAAYQFLHNQAEELETQMVGMEQKLAAFKAKYGGSLPDMQTHNLSRIDSLQHDLESTQREILIAQQKETELQLQLNNIAPSLTSAVGDWRVQLAKLKSDLADAQQRYTPAHPEVKRLQRAITELQAQGGASMKLGAATPDNPDYLQVKSQLDSARRELANLHTMEARARADMSNYEKNLTTAPNVQREYVQLSRDYDNARARYEDLQTKMKNAALAQTMETEARGEKFSLLHEPAVPRVPYYPNRLGIILLGIVIGCALGFGMAAIMDVIDPSVRGSGDLAGLIDMGTLGVVPVMLNPWDRRKRRLGWTAALVIYGAAGALVTTIVLSTSA